MAEYGMEILTQNGTENVANLVSVRLIDTVTSTQSSGSYTAPSLWRPGSDSFLVVARNSTNPPQISLAGRTISWTTYRNDSADFALYIFSINSPNTEIGYGFVAYNNDQRVVIDSQFSPISYKSAGTHTSSANYSDVAWPHNIPCDVGDIVALDVPVGQYMATGAYIDGNRQLYHSQQVVDYMVLAPGLGDPYIESAYGLILYDAAGNRVFDSRVRIIVIAGSVAETPNNTVRIDNLPSNATFVACYGPRWILLDQQAGGAGQEAYQGYAYYYGMERVSDSRLQLKAVPIAAVMGISPIYGPIPNDSIVTAIVGRGYSP